MFLSTWSVSSGFRYCVLSCKRQRSGKRFILGSVPLDGPPVSLPSKYCAGLFMRTAGRDLAGKAALLECFNEEA
jgi:hypothetical protein